MSEISELLGKATELAASLNRETRDFGKAAEMVAKLDTIAKGCKAAGAIIELKVLDAAANGVDVEVSTGPKKFKVTKGKSPYFLASRAWEWLKDKTKKVVVHYTINGKATTTTLDELEESKEEDGSKSFFSKQGNPSLKTEDVM